MAKEFNDETYLTIIEVAQYTERTTNTIHQNWKRYGLTPVKFGKNLYFSKNQVTRWLLSYAEKGVRQAEVA